jgi:alkanesulfonate monooxygenase SsuD/methylene tetrahydromethanopterin reductase-like flavin-dependent oxidoreductase (luciferase family)
MWTGGNSMSKPIHFGWRVPDWSFDGSSARAFSNQVFENLEAVQGLFSSAWVADHFQPWLGAQDQTTGVFECWTELAYLAGKFPDLFFGTIVMAQSYRPPALLAKMATSLQALSAGRFILGIGAGWKEDEYRAYGYEFPPAATRIHQLEEAVQIIRKMWTETRATFHGKYYHIDQAICEPKPDPLPPLMIGGGGRKLTLRVVAKYADWWNIPGATAKEYQELLGVLKEHCQAVGRNFDDIRKTYSNDCVAIAPSQAEARRMAESNRLCNLDEDFVGTPDQVAAQFSKYIDLGVDLFIIRFADFPRPDGALLFAREVMPRFTGG